MLRLQRPHRSVVTLLSLSFAVVLGCGEGAGSGANVHGAVTGVGDGRASSIQVSPSTATIEQGAIAPLSCLAVDSRGVVVSMPPSWNMTDPKVATVDANGAVAAQRPGTAVASCTVDGKTATATITVVASPVAFLEVTPGAGVLVLGKSLQLSGTPLDSNGAVVADHRVQWSTVDSAIATVSPTGAVVGHLEGTANVIAVSGGKAAFAKINVAKQPPAPVGSISIRLDDATLNVGQLAHASATTTDVNGQIVTGRSIIWSVDNSSVIAAVSTAGDKANITGRGQGMAVLTATSEGQSSSVTVTVAMAPVQTVAVALESPTILPGQTTQATAQLKDALGNVLTGRTVTWSSLDPSIATVSPVGVVTGVSTGAVIIRATSEGQTGDGTETVGSAPVATVTVNLSSTTLAPGQSTQATAIARDANGNVLTGRSVAWASLNTSIATVSISGVVTAVSAGSATIQATVETKIGTTTLTVASSVPVATVAVTLGSTSLTPGQTTQATAVARDASGNVLTGRIVGWSSLNTSVATVSSSGLVTAVAAGAATIRATVETKVGDGALTITSLLTTTTAAVVATVDSSTLAAGHTAQGHAVAKDALGNVLTGKTVSWTSNNTAIATVNATTGLVTAVTAGSAVVQATVDGVAGQASVNVTVPSIITAPSPTGTHTNQPSGFLALNQLTFDKLPSASYDPVNSPGWQADLGGGALSLVSDATSPGSTTSVGQMRFPAGFPSGVAPAQLWTAPQLWASAPKTIYIAFWFKISSNWYGNTSGINKVAYAWINNNPAIAFEMYGVGTGALQPIASVQGIQAITGVPLSGGAAILWPNAAADTISRGVWHSVEMVLGANSTGAADGTIKWWLDGHLSGSYTNVVQWTASQHQWEWMQWNPIYGGAGTPVPADQYMWMKNLYVSGQ